MGNIVNKIKLNARTLKIAVGSTTAAALVGTSFAAAGSAQTLVQNLLGYVFAIFKYIGWLLLAWGVGQLVLAFKNEDADSKSRAMMLIVVAIILTSIGTIFNGVMSGQVSAATDVNI